MNNTILIPGPKKLPAMAGWSAGRGFTVIIIIIIIIIMIIIMIIIIIQNMMKKEAVTKLPKKGRGH